MFNARKANDYFRQTGADDFGIGQIGKSSVITDASDGVAFRLHSLEYGFGVRSFEMLFEGSWRDFFSSRLGFEAGFGGGKEVQPLGISSNSALHGGVGDDRLFGGLDNDIIRGHGGDDKLFGGYGDDSLFGGSGDDKLFGGSGNDTLSGANGDDLLKGDSGQDTVFGGNGDDRVVGGSGNDALFGGNGDDFLSGGSGSDEIDGGTGADRIRAGSGNDTITGGLGDDNINGGGGLDTVIFTGSVSDYAITFVNGTAVVTGDAAQGTDTLNDIETLVFDDYTLDLTAPNNAPLALDDDFSGDEDTQITGNVLADNGNGADFDLETPSLNVVAAVIMTANGGTVTLNANGSFTYDPAGDFNGEDSFTYTVTDGFFTDTGTVTLTVNAVNDAPVAKNDAFAGDEDTQIVGNVLADNGFGADTDLDGDTLGVVAEVITTANGGTVTLLVDGSFTYDPALNYNGPDSFQYTLTDGSLTDTATVNITVHAVNDAAAANDDTAAATVGVAETIDVFANDSDAELDAFSVTGFTQPENGTVTETSPGVFSYVSNDEFIGVDTFTYTISDGFGEFRTATVSVTVTEPAGPNTAPIARDADIEAVIDSGEFNVFTIDFNTLTVNGTPIISDVQQPLSALDITNVTILGADRVPVQFVETSPGSNIFTLDLDALNLDPGEFQLLNIQYTVDDGQASDNTATGQINLTVTHPDEGAANNAPTAADATINHAEADGTITVNLAGALGLATDLDGDALTVTSIYFTDGSGNLLGFDPLERSGTTEAGGIVSFDPNVFGLADTETGIFQLHYTVSDGQATSSGVVTLNLTGSANNVAPTTTIADVTLVYPDDTPFGSGSTFEFDLNSYVFDADFDDLTISLVSVTVVDNSSEPPTETVVTGSIVDGVVTIDATQLNIVDGSEVYFEIDYTVSDGVNPDVAGTLNVTVSDPAEQTGVITENFEGYSSESGSTIELADLAGLRFEGTATVIEVDELGSRAATGLIAGETTVPTGATPDGNAAVITGDFTGYDVGGLPEYSFTVFGNGATIPLDGGLTFTPTPQAAAFDLEQMSLTAMSGADTTVTIITYRYEEVSPFQYQYVEVGQFDVTVSSTSANELDFTTGQFADAFLFDDPETTGVVETSAFENIVAFQIVTTGALTADEHGGAGDTIPVFDDPLVIDDMVFDFG